MKNNKKGLSTIVATLLIILLTLVAVGIIWIVVRNVVQGGSTQINVDAMCLESEVVATQVSNATNESFSVTLQRKGGEDELGGVKLVFTNVDEQTSYPVDVPGSTYPLAALATRTVTVNVPNADLPNPTKVSVVAYFLVDGKEQLCKTATQLTFA